MNYEQLKHLSWQSQYHRSNILSFYLSKMKNEFIKKYTTSIQGVISCYDRILIRGTLPTISYPGGMNSLLYGKGIELKDITKFTSPLRTEVHDNAKAIAKTSGIEIEFIRNPKVVRKEELAKEQIDARKITQGLVCIFSAMESCVDYKLAFDKTSGMPKLRFSKGRCLHYYFYFIDTEYGLCHFRVPTWCPFQLQFYFNAHNWLANQLDKKQIDYKLQDNAFTYLSDYEQAQKIADSFSVKSLQKKLDLYALLYCPVTNQISHSGYHWSIRQLEYATDIVFKSKGVLGPLYEELLKTMMHTVSPDDVARFLGKKEVHPSNNRELETTHKQVIRQEMRRIKHRMGETSIKMYDKFGQVLRIETTTYNTTNFTHYRSVEHRDGTKSSKLAPVKKSIYSLKPLAQIMLGCNKRYLDYIAAFEVPMKGKKRLIKIANSKKEKDRNYKGFNFFDKNDEKLFKIIANGNFILRGFRNKDIRKLLTDKSVGQISRLIKRLRVHGLIKKAGKTYKYYLTTLGRTAIATALNVKELFFVKQLNY